MKMNPVLLEPTLLWSNPNPNNALDETSISINNTAYNWLIIVYKEVGNSDWGKKTAKIGASADNSYNQIQGMGGSSRTIRIYSGSISFNKGYNGSGNEDNYALVPIAVYGTNTL